MEALSGYEETLKAQEHQTGRPQLAHSLVEDALTARASDIHLEPGDGEVRVRLRIDGAVSDAASLTPEQGRWLINQFKAVANLDPVARFTPTDSHARVSINERPVYMRLALAPCQRGETLSIRLLYPHRLEQSLDTLGLTDSNLQRLEHWLDNVNGLFLTAGPTGCGKTTTVYSLLHELKFTDSTVVSIEDPVEYEVSGITQVQLDERHHLSFAEGVKAMLRLYPDFLMVGEIRDSASAHGAVDAAISGRVLLSTVHTRDAVGVVSALRNWGLPDHEIAESLAVVVTQRLVRQLCRDCRKLNVPTDRDLHWPHCLQLPVPKFFWPSAGCPKCGGLGYFGRTGIFELWRLQEMDYRLILEHCDDHSLRSHFHSEHGEGLLLDGLAKVADGVTSLSELRKATSGLFAPGPLDSRRSKLAGRRKNSAANSQVPT